MVHGFMGGSAQWANEVGLLADSHEVIALDLPGFGANNDQPAVNTISGFADWVIAELDQRGVQDFHLLGHSMGGMIVQEVAHNIPHRVKKLVLYATGAKGVLPGRFETIAQSKARALSDGAGATARRIAATWFLQRENDPAYRGCMEIAERASLAAILAGLDAMQSWSGEDTLAALEPETLVIWGDRDRTYAWEQIAQLWNTIPDAHLAVAPACAHAVHLEKPALFGALLQDFLARDA
jgi:pimeloyl-ACP methyl ester carboxylesterase